MPSRTSSFEQDAYVSKFTRTLPAVHVRTASEATSEERPIKRQKTKGLNARFDAMLRRANSTHCSGLPPFPEHRRSVSSATSSSSISEPPKTPVDAYHTAVEQRRLGKNFSIVRLKGTEPSEPKAKVNGTEWGASNSGPSSTQLPGMASLPTWLSRTFASLDQHHPLRALVPSKIQDDGDSFVALHGPMGNLLYDVEPVNESDMVFAFLPPSPSGSFERLQGTRESRAVTHTSENLDGSNSTYTDIKYEVVPATVSRPYTADTIPMEAIGYNLTGCQQPVESSISQMTTIKIFSTPGPASSFAIHPHRRGSFSNASPTKESTTCTEEPDQHSTTPVTPCASFADFFDADAKQDPDAFGQAKSVPVLQQLLGNPPSCMPDEASQHVTQPASRPMPFRYVPETAVNFGVPSGAELLYTTPGPIFCAPPVVYFASPTEDPADSDPAEPPFDAINFCSAPSLFSQPETTVTGVLEPIPTVVLDVFSTPPQRARHFSPFRAEARVAANELAQKSDSDVPMLDATPLVAELPTTALSHSDSDSDFDIFELSTADPGDSKFNEAQPEAVTDNPDPEARGLVFAPAPGIFISPLRSNKDSDARSTEDAQARQVHLSDKAVTMNIAGWNRVTSPNKRNSFDPPLPTFEDPIDSWED